MTWEDLIALEKDKPYYKELKSEIDKRYETTTVFPEKQNIFKAFSLTNFENLKVVILGQDPYHGFGQAQGLAFSTPAKIKVNTKRAAVNNTQTVETDEILVIEQEMEDEYKNEYKKLVA